MSGIQDGDSVVVNGNFLIDAESNLQSALKGLTAPPADGGTPMIARLIAWSARNLMLVLIATAFAVVGGVWALTTLPLDAIPDLSDTQVIVYTEFPGQAPQVVEDQVTYPLTTSMLTVPRSKVVRGFSFFGVSFVYVIFEDGTDIYWARSRVLEYLNAAGKRLPAGVTPTLGPDATGVGWVYQYAVVAQEQIPRRAALAAGLGDPLRAGQGRGRRRGRQRRRLRQAVQRRHRSRPHALPRHPAVKGARGHPRQQHGRRRPHARACRARVHGARPRLHQRHRATSRSIVVKIDGGTPVLLKDIARVELGPDERRGIAELNGEGEVASGIALQRFGANALNVIDNVKAAARGDCPVAARRRRGGAGLRPLGAHSPRHRHPARRRSSRKASWWRWSASSSCCTCAARWSPSSCSPSAS